MNIAARQSHLLQAMKILSKVATTKTSMAALGCVHTWTDGRRIDMTATDLTNTVTVSVDTANPAACDHGAVVVPLKMLRDAVKSCADKQSKSDDPMVLLEWFGRNLTVSANVRFTINGENIDSFPEIAEPRFADDQYVEYNSLHEAISFVSPAMCKDETRFHLNGVGFVGTDIVATDGVRLHCMRGMPKVPGSDYDSYIIPERMVKTLAAAMDDKHGKVYAWFKPWKHEAGSFSQNIIERGCVMFQLYHKRCHIKAYCTTVDAAFPPYQQVFPTQSKYAFTIERTRLESVCRAAKKSATYGRGLMLDAESQNFLKAHVDNPERMMAMTVEAKIEKTVGLCVDPAYLHDAVISLPQDHVCLHHGDGQEPIRIDGPNRIAVIMPMRRHD